VRHFFVINPHSFPSREELDALITDIHENMTAYPGIRYDTYITRYPRDAVATIHHYLNALPPQETLRVYAVGGDGILFDCLNGMAGHQNAELTTVPYGKTNNFVRVFGENAAPRFRDIRGMIQARPQPMDIINCGSNYAINHVAVGLESYAVIKANAFLRRNQSKYTKLFVSKLYNLYAIRAMLSEAVTRQAYRITADGEDVSGPYVNLRISNGAYNSGKKVSNRKAKPNDGVINMTMVKPTGLLTMLWRLSHFNSGKLDDVRLFRQRAVKKIDITSDMPLCVHMDGEAFYTAELHIELKPGMINFAVPEGMAVQDYSAQRQA
jgi:diacylglycerol kinase family enzyme